MLRLVPEKRVMVAFCSPMAKARTGAAKCGAISAAPTIAAASMPRIAASGSLLAQDGAEGDAHHERRDDDGALHGIGVLRAGERDAQQHRVAGHCAGERTEGEETDGVGIARDDRQDAGLPDSVIG